MNAAIPKLSKKILPLPAVGAIFRTSAIAVLSGLRFFGISPVGLAYSAAVSSAHPACALFGMGIGCAFSGSRSLSYLFSLLLYYVLTARKKSVAKKFPCLTLCLSSAAVFGGELLIFTPTVSGAISKVFEIVICIGLFSVFIADSPQIRRASEIVVLSGLLAAASEITLPLADLHPSTAVGIFICVCFCCNYDAHTAVLLCSALSFISFVPREDAVELCGAAAIASTLSAYSKNAGRAAACVGFLCGVSVAALYRGKLLPFSPADIFTPLLLFALLPEKIHYIIGNFFSKHFVVSENRDPKTVEKLRSVASVLSELSRGIANGKKTIPSSPTAADTALERVCSACPLFGGCPNACRAKISEIAAVLERDGFCDSTNLPESFRTGCIKVESLLCEFRHAYELDKQGALFSGEVGVGRSIMAQQYAEISQAIETLSDELILPVAEPCDNCITVSVTSKSLPKRGNSVCGDTLVHFKNKNTYFIILCDGMGSGEPAAHQSRLAAELFRRFITSGFDKHSALSIINSALALKSDRESFSTADILEIDLCTGDAHLMKIGSAQSLLKTSHGTEVISSKALPIGILEEVCVEPEVRTLRPGDVILMLSDGIGEAGSGILKNDWIKKILESNMQSDANLCDAIVSGAASRAKYSDDMTCCVVRIKRNRGESDETCK